MDDYQREFEKRRVDAKQREFEKTFLLGPFLPKEIAEQNGLKLYFTGLPCKHGHYDLRFVKGGRCLECNRLAARRQRDVNREHINSLRRQRVASNPKLKSRIKEQKEASRLRNIAAESPQDREVRLSRQRASQARFRSGDTYQANKKAYRDRSRDKNPNVRIGNMLRVLVKQACNLQSSYKQSSTVELLGCSYAYLRQHLSGQFDEQMSWSNHSKDGWHIDHIRPCSSFDLSDISQQRVAFNWRNLRPMMGRDNQSKSDSYSPSDEVEWVRIMRDLGFSGDLYLLYN